MRRVLGRLIAFLPHLRRRRAAADTRDEFAFHLEARTETLMRGGLSREAAARQARIEFGSIAGYEEKGREARGFALLDDLARDLRFGLRMLRRQPGTTLVIILTLALGIGANTAIFSVVDAVLLRPLPVKDPNRLVLFSGDPFTGSISGDMPEGAWVLFSSEVYEFLRAERLPFESIGAFASDSDSVTMRVLGSDRGESTVRAHLVSGNYFDVMGVGAALGRAFRTTDDRPEAAPVAVISDRLWRTAFGASPSVIGVQVRLNQTAFTIVGVAPASFFGERVADAPGLWVPLARQPEIQLRESFLERPDYYWLSLIGRLAPGQNREAAQAAVTAALRRFLTAQAGSSMSDTTRDRIRGARVDMVSGARGISPVRQHDARPLMLLLIAVGLVLLIACANVATLLLCRAAARNTEVAVRRALGAGRARLARQWLTESVVLGVVGAAAGVLLAYWLAPTLLSFFPAGPLHATIDGSVLLFTIGITSLASLIFGLAPALQASGVDALASLRSTGRGTNARHRAFGATEPFIVAQIATALVLALGATLFARSLFNLEREPLGFDQDRVLTVEINPRLAGYTPADVGLLYTRLYRQLAVLPGVESATFARYSPFSGGRSINGATIDGYVPRTGEHVGLETVPVGPDYPETLGMPLVAGRAVRLTDDGTAPQVAMVNEAFVRRYFPASNPLGHHFQFGKDRDYEIVGVVKDALFHNARDASTPVVFTSMLQERSQRALNCELTLRARAGVHADSLAPLVRQIVAATDSRVVVNHAETLREQVLATFEPERIAAGFVGVFAALALLIAAVGLYGVVSYGVARRTKEIGVRLALGAAPGEIVRLILRETLIWLAIGVTLGGLASLAAGRLVASQLFGIRAADPISFLIAAAILAIVALLTSLIPAVRARRIDPIVALRAE